MELSPADKQRILDEERRRRAAEEEYRAQVRQQLAAEAASPKTTSPPTAAATKQAISRVAPFTILFMVVALLIVGAAFAYRRATTPGTKAASSGLPDAPPLVDGNAPSKTVVTTKQSEPPSIQSVLPQGAKIIETAKLTQQATTKSRALVLWMLRPTRNSGVQEYCGTSVQGDFWSGPARLSLVDPAEPKLINTVKITGEIDPKNDSFSLPFFVSNAYYHVPHPNNQHQGKPELLHLQNFTGGETASQFVLFQYEACGIVAASVFGYEAGSDRAFEYQVEMEQAGEKHVGFWVQNIFSRKPDAPGYWQFSWSPGHGSDATFHEEVSFDGTRRMFIEQRTISSP